MNVQEDKTVSFQGINETNTEKKLQCCMSLANQFVIYEKKNIYKFVGHSVFVACHQEGLYKQIPSPRVMP